MISDLVGSGESEVNADFVVIGAGTVGLPVAVQLAKQLDKRIVVLESGAEQQHEQTHPLNRVVSRPGQYSDTAHQRFRCLGGTSTRWGGAMIPFQPSDLDFAGWPIKTSELEKYLVQVEAFFGLDEGAYDEMDFPYFVPDDFVIRSAKWPPMKNLNVYRLLAGDCARLRNLDIRINATVTKLIATDGDRLEITAQSLHGDKIHVCADRVIVAAGAIETTRLALLIDRQNKHAISKVCPGLGQHFSDHISVPIATIATEETATLNRVFGFRFGKKDSIRNLRIELANDSVLRNTLPPYFVHIAAETSKPNGYDALRDYFKSLQMRKAPSASVLSQLLRHAPWLARALWWRIVDRRLLFPAEAEFVVHMVIEQRPNLGNRITLSDVETDSFGLPLAEIEWTVSKTNIDDVLRTVDAVESMWKASALAALGDWSGLDRSLVVAKAMNGGGYLHPTGSTRMADRPEDGVVDADLRLFPFPRIQLLATSVLPTGGGANPTMTLMCLGMRCVDKHVREIGRLPYDESVRSE